MLYVGIGRIGCMFIVFLERDSRRFPAIPYGLAGKKEGKIVNYLS
jgi:hypothetical protein